MLGDTSEFAPLDLLGALAVNAVGTNMACKDPSFRVGIKNKQGEVPAWADFRFLGGVTAALIGQFGGPQVRRVGHDAAVGLLGSYVSTETCRRHAMARLQAAQGPQAQTQQLPGGQQAVSGSHVQQPEYANYGW